MSTRTSNIIHPANRVPRWPFTANRGSIQANGLELWYPFAGSHGSEGIRRVYSRRPDAPLLPALQGGSAIRWVGSPINGSAVQWDTGTSPLITLGAFSELLVSDTTASFAFWYRKTDSTLRATTAFGGALSGSRIVAHLPFSDGTVYWDWADFGTGRLSVPVSVTTNWEHWAFTVAPSAMAIYRNGVQIASKGASSTLTIGGDSFILGSVSGTSAADNAEMSDFRYYSKALSQEEVWALYDPATRYELYQEVGRRAYSFLSGSGPVGGRTTDHHHLLGVAA